MATVTETIILGVSDQLGRELGSVEVESISDGLVLGEFVPGPDYPAVEAVFRTFAEMVEMNSLHFVGEAAEAINQIGVTIRAHPSRPPIAVWDVQIYPDGGFSCRLPAGGNGSHP